MRSSTNEQITEIQIQKESRNVIRVLQLILPATIIVNVLEFYLASTLDAWQLAGTGWMLLAFNLVALLAWRLAARGRPVLAMWLVFVVMVIVTAVPTAFFIANIGFVVVLSLLLLIPAMAVQAFSSNQQIVRATLWSFIGALITLMAELYGSENRLVVPALETVLPIATALMGIAYGVFIYRRFPQYSIRSKFVISAVLLVTMTIIALTFVISRNTRTTIIDATGQRLNNVATSQGLVIGELLARQINLIQSLGLNQAIQANVQDANDLYDGDSADIQEQLEQLEAEWQTAEFTDPLPQSRVDNEVAAELLEFQTLFQTNLSLLVTDQYGGLVGATNDVSHFSYAEEPWWQTAYNNGRGAIFVGPPEINQDTEIFQTIIAVPIFDSNSETVIGVLQNTYSLRDLRDILVAAQQEVGGTIHLDLFLPPNRLIDIEGSEVEGRLSTETLAQLQNNRNETFAQFEFHNGLNLVSQEPVNTLMHVPDVDVLGWVVITHQPLNDSLAPVRDQQRTFISIGVAVLLLASLATAVTGQSLTQPIINLTETAVQVSEGDLAIQAQVETEDELGTLAEAFNVMTTRLRQTIALQEQRISERTRALEVSSEVSRRLSTILHKQELVKEVVNQVQEAFNYYHVHIYLFDNIGENLVMVGGTGEAGKKMLEAGHTIPRGKGLVGRAAETKMTVLVEDVTDDPGWLPNPLLPESVAEVAVPILVGDDVLGVLDVQHNVESVLRQEDADLLQSIANQVAIALQNAEAYRRAQNQAQREALINEIGQKIQSTTSVDMALKIAVRELGQALAAEQTVVKLKNGSTNGRQPEPNEPVD